MSTSTLFAFFGMPGHIELILIALLALLFFGKRLPSVMRSMGQGITEFKKGVQGIEDDVNSAGATTINDDKKSEG